MTKSAALIVICFLMAQNVHAVQDGSEIKNVVLVSMSNCCVDEAWPEAEKAAALEFQTINLNVMILDGEVTDRSQWINELKAITSNSNADCAIRIYRSSDGKSNGVDLWIEKDSGELTFKHIPLGVRTDSEAVAIATLRSLEAIRAGLLSQQFEPGLSDEETSPEPTPIPQETTVPETESEKSTKEKLAKTFAAGVGLGAAGSPGGARIHGAVDITLEWNPVPMLSFEINGALSVIGPDIEAHGEASSFNFALVRAFGHYEFLQTGRLRPSLGIGGGVAFAWTEGSGSEELSDVKDRVQVWYIGASGRLGLVLTDRFWLVAGTRVGVLLPDVETYFGDDEVSTFGRPLIEGFLSLKVRFP